MDRNAYIQKMEAQLKEWKAEMDALAARAEQSEADAKIEIKKQVDELRARYDAMREQFEALRVAGGETFDEMKATFESVVNEFTTKFTGMSTAARQETSTSAS